MSACAALALLALFGIGLLASGWSGLEARLPGGLPLGNVVSAASLIFAAASASLLSARGTRIRMLSSAALALAVLWLPISIALAGNLDLNFGDSTGPAWFAFTALATLASFGSLLIAFVSFLRSRRGRARGA